MRPALIAYSDGLVERRGSDVDADIGRLRNVLASIGDSPIEMNAETVVRAISDDRTRDDDVVVVCVTRNATENSH